MSCNLTYMSGYGISQSDLEDLLKEEYKEINLINICDEIGDDYITSFSSPENEYLYIRDMPPYEQLFISQKHIDEYFYKKLKPYLKEDVDFKQLSYLLDDVFDYDYC